MHLGKTALLAKSHSECTIVDITHNGCIIAKNSSGEVINIQNREDIIFI